MPFILPILLSFQGSTHLFGVGSFSNVIKTGIMIKDDTSSIAPTIYLDDYEKEYNQNNFGIEDIVDNVLKIYYKHSGEEQYNIVSWITDANEVKDKIIYRTVNAELNSELLKNIPHKIFLDLAVTFHVLVSSESDSEATILVSNSLAQKWNFNVEELMKIASENRKRIMPSVVSELSSVLSEFLDIDNNCSNFGMPLYVITNTHRLYGACTLLEEDVLHALAEKLDDNLILLPSSVHEIIAVPERRIDISQCTDLINSVNDEHVSPQEVLSNHPYLYLRNNHAVVMA